MSNTWIRGPRCGVDNCRSRHYRTVDGRRICQYGHVNEGHVEFNDDDDENFVVTKRLKLPTNTTGLSQASQITPGLQKDESKRKLYGVAGRELYFKCFQCVLKAQVNTLINDHGFPKIFETIVKSIYVEYLTVDNNVEFGEESGFTTQDTTFTNQASEDREFRFKKLPSHIDSLAICYLSCRYLNLPIYINDFVQWTTTNRIPYMRASFNIPKILRDKLAVNMTRLFEPKRPPLRGDLCMTITKVANSLKLNGLELNYEPLLFKVVKELILPPQIYFAVKKIINLKNVELKISETVFKTRKAARVINDFPEIKLISIIICMTKLYFLNGHFNPEYKTYDWKKWMEIIENLDLDQDDTRNFNNALSSLLLSKNSSNEVIEWDERQTEKYLDWFTQRIVNTQTIEVPTALKRLYDIFELPETQLEEQKDPEDAINTTEIAFKKLLESESNHELLTSDEVVRIENLFIENLISNFGLTETQLRLAIRHNELKLFPTQN